VPAATVAALVHKPSGLCTKIRLEPWFALRTDRESTTIEPGGEPMPRTRRNNANPAAAVAYLRVSTDDQALGPEAQRAAIEAWAAARGVAVVAWFCDQGVSGAAAIDKRPALLDALAALRSATAWPAIRWWPR
jgi:hypothetical protein